MRNLILSALLIASALQTAVGEKFKVVMAGYILFVSALHADDTKARMERNKIFSKSASELTTEYPKTVRTVQQSNVVKTDREYGPGREYGPAEFVLELWELAAQRNPQFISELVKVGQAYMEEDGLKPADLFKAPETNSVSNHNHSK